MTDIAAMVLRVAVTYVFLLVIVRLSGKRTVREGTPFDLVVALILADFPDDVIWGEVAVADGFVAMGTIMLLHLVVVYGTYRSPAFHRLVSSTPVHLYRAGALVHTALRRERVNPGELMAVVRQKGFGDWPEVREAILEPTGEVSVLKHPESQRAQKRDLPALREGVR